MSLPSPKQTAFLLAHLNDCAASLLAEQKAIGMALTELREQRLSIYLTYLTEVNQSLDR